MNKTIKNIILWVVIGVVLIFVFSNFGQNNTNQKKITYSQFIEKIQNGEIKQIMIDKQLIDGISKNDEYFSTYAPTMLDQYTIDEEWINKYNINIKSKQPEQQSVLLHIFISWFPIIIFIAIWIFFMRQLQGGGKGAMSFGKSKARLISDEKIKITFKDVAGVDEAKEETYELIEFLKNPSKFYNLGGKIPKGILLIGPPGTGKTLLAKAIAGEAKVPFFTISGSDFVEMFVGVGASRVRDMFEQAKKHSPCIIFIDEIDAVGRHRGAGLGGGHDEREQTLNQLLVEMDGFSDNTGIIIIAATNRPDVLDPALLRPGRFDRQISVNLPDLKGRIDILKVHIRKVPIDKDVNIELIARGTPGFSGADLANLINESTLYTAKINKTLVNMEALEKAKDKLLMGVEKKSLMITEEEKKLIAYHEAGHTIVGLLSPEHDPVYKVTIIPRTMALGVTIFLPKNDKYLHNKTQLESQVTSLFGGRVAEELIYGKEKITTGAANDIKHATDISRKMVVKWGLSEKIGPINLFENDEEVFLGHQITRHKNISEETVKLIDKEIKNIITLAYFRATKILTDNIDKLHIMADALIKYETINVNQILDIMSGKDLTEKND
ncbi:ATP-dependent zinc metalloprotease FtsH [Candidatus Azoamicus ciliaticola]|uniref:ATP-dependent zinc metalloprotease FtsH n=1 Tax=Candidatus Azoamicus ciliaticola TaxID=2652803 RepID=A0A6J5JWQ8_9GAMM|nr:ATP-dependent zinc metalloprotease FtsH [Candidatus Azoamicus ciliaticola]CAB3976464.1 ATP-dependent zinc metalloprotease FtsH [Candidatus Azoamicus ciliaticola]